ncbi:MAG: DUF1049 domain-containing protein [Chitinophagaceae bacterium]|nr:DUF1049 domain-containing protein [Chitinophagaceae bacterium]
MKQFKTFLLALIVIIFVVFAVQNFETVQIKLFSWGISLPLALLTVAIYILGMFTGGLLWSNLKKLTKHEEEGAKKETRSNV